MNITDPFDEAAKKVPERLALIVDGVETTYLGLALAVERVAAALSAAGVEPGDRVPLVDAAGLLTVAGVLGCARIGAAAAPMSARATAHEIASMAAAAACTNVAIAGVESADRVGEALGSMPLDPDMLSAPEETVVHAPVSDGDTAVVLFTSGTTGTPKPVPLTHGVLGSRVRVFTPPPDPNAPANTILSCVPFHHVAGLVGVLVGLAGGNTNVLMPRFDAGEWLSTVERYRVQRVFLVPAMLQRILSHAGFAGSDLSSLQMITYGAAPASADLVARALAAFPPSVSFVQVFGQTETLGAVAALGPADHAGGRAGSVGKPMAGVEVRIVDPASGAEGDLGELWVHAEHTATPGWLRTGDLVRRDTDGYLHAVGRLSDVINRGGEKVDPAEVEAALRAHPSIADVAVAGYGDAEMGQRVGALVVAVETVDDELLRTWCRTRLEPHKVPERIVFVDAIPLTELGKVSRRELRAVLER